MHTHFRVLKICQDVDKNLILCYNYTVRMAKNMKWCLRNFRKLRTYRLENLKKVLDEFSHTYVFIFVMYSYNVRHK